MRQHREAKIRELEGKHGELSTGAVTFAHTECRAEEARCILPTPIGPLRIVASGGFIVEVQLTSHPTAGGETSHPHHQTPMEQTSKTKSPLLLEACRQLKEYFSHQRKIFQLPTKQAGTPFQQQVWQVLESIPYGETRSYQDIARAIGNPKAMRAVGQANNRNKILILVPCHRVIQKDGQLGGFEFGVDAKKWLLELECQT